MNGIDEVNNVQVGMSRMKPDKKKKKKKLYYQCYLNPRLDLKITLE